MMLELTIADSSGSILHPGLQAKGGSHVSCLAKCMTPSQPWKGLNNTGALLGGLTYQPKVAYL